MKGVYEWLVNASVSRMKGTNEAQLHPSSRAWQQWGAAPACRPGRETGGSKITEPWSARALREGCPTESVGVGRDVATFKLWA